MIRVGITGQAGFIGTHLYNTLGLSPEKYKRISFDDSFFSNKENLLGFISKCDIIVHLAAVNRHDNPDTIYETNIDLVKKLLTACETVSARPHIIFSSSTQEEKDNKYGRSKKKGRELFENWAINNNTNFTGLIIPNVFGPFGNPYYNSVVATFCHQLTHNETPQIDVDGELRLIYVSNLVSEIITRIISINEENKAPNLIEKIVLPYSYDLKVSELLQKLTDIKETYFEYGILPDLDNEFDLYLFNTFLTYIDHNSFFPFKLKLKSDDRGSFVETVKLRSGGQISFSVTKPGITRGNHFHTRKAERFAVIKGKARIEIRRIGTEKKCIFNLNGADPSFVDMPVWHTHNITNTGNGDLYTIFWINEFFNQSDPDTYFEVV